MKNKFFFVVLIFVVFCTERLERTFYVGFFDLYPARVVFLLLLPYFDLKLFRKGASPEVYSLFKAFCIYLILVFLSVFKSSDFFYSFKKWLDTLTLHSFVFLSYCFLLKSAKHVRLLVLHKLFLKYFQYIVFICFVGVFFFYRIGFDGGLEERTFGFISFYRRTSLFRDPNFFSSFLVVSFFIIYFSKIKLRLHFLVMIIIAIFLTGSKGGLAALFLTLVLYFRSRIPILRSKVFIYGLVSLLATVFSFVMFAPFTIIGLITSTSFFKAEYGAETLLPRILVWHSGMKAYLNDFWLGIGPGNIVNISKGRGIDGLLSYMQTNGFYGLGNETIDKLATHSTYLEVLFESGILTFIFYILFIYKIFRILLRASFAFPQIFLGFTLGFISFYITILFLSYNTYYMSFLTGFYLFCFDKFKSENINGTKIQHNNLHIQ